MANKTQNEMMAKRMKEEGTGKWPNSISQFHGWRGVGHADREMARRVGKHVEPSGKNYFGMLGGVLAERLGYKSPINLPV